MRPFVLFLAAALVAGAAETGNPVDQAACKPAGFKVIRFGTNEVKGKSGASFNVLIDSANYQSNSFDAALRSAMSSWSSAGSAWRYNFLSYTNSPATSSDGRMTISKGGMAFPAGVLATTLTSAISSTAEIVDSDIFVNPSVPLSTTPGPAEFDFESIAVHEMGHGLGLDHNDDCGPTETVMSSGIKAGVIRRSLFSAETAGVSYLYPGSGSPPTSSSLSVSPSALVFSAPAGGSEPASQPLTLTGPASSTWTGTVSTSSGGDWLSISPSSGTGPGAITVSVSTTGLPGGFYTGRVTVVSGGILNSVVISLNLTGIDASPSSLSFSAVAGGPAPNPQTLILTGVPGISWNATVATFSGGGWLRLSTSSGTLPAAPSVFVSPTGLAPDNYAGKITLSAGGVTREVTVQFAVTGAPQLVVDPTQLTLTSSASSTVPVCGTFAIRSTGNAILDWSASAGTAWLSLAPLSGRSPASVSVCVNAANLSPGTYNSTVSIAGSAPNSPLSVAITLTVTSSTGVSDGGVVNAASFAPGQAISANEMLTLFGVNLASQTVSVAAFPLPTDLADTRVVIAGVPARLIYVSPQQINLVTPSTVPSTGSTTLTVFNGRQASPTLRVALARQTPGVFTMLGNGAGAGAVTHVDGSVVTRANPLAPGEAFSVYLTGIGPLDRFIADGEPAPSDTLARATSTVRLLVDGREATVLFAGAVPGFAGLHVVVAQAPELVARRAPEIVIDVQGTQSNRFTAGGASLLDVSPASVRSGADVTVALRGINLSPSSALSVAGTTIPGAFTDGAFLQTLRVTIPARLLGGAGSLALRVVDSDAPSEPASNPINLGVDR